MTPRLGRGWALLALGVLALAGLAIRVGASATVFIWFEAATRGLMGRDVLSGQFPFYFYGQPFMGAVDAYLHAVSFALLGESVATLRVWALLVSLGHVAVVFCLARRVFGDGWWAAALVLVPSPYLLKWASEARLAYGLILVLAPLCLLLAVGVVDSRLTPVRRTRALVILALVSGLGWWNNLLLAPVLVACAPALALRRPRLGRAAVLAPLAFLLGSAPVWLFTTVYARRPAVSVPLAPSRGILDHARDLLTNALPLVAGVPRAALAARPIGIVVSAIVALGAALALGDPRGDRVGRLLLGLATTISLVTVVVTERGQTLSTEDPRYLLPVLALLPVLLGGALARIARRRPVVAGAAVVGLVLAHGVALAMVYPALRSADAWRASRVALARPAAVADALAARGFNAVYTHDPDVLTFASGGRVTVSHFYLADDAIRARQVDRAPRVAYLAPEQIPAGFVESLAAAGIGFEREVTPLGPLFTGFRLEPAAAYREIPPTGWSATASPRPELAGHAIDRDAGTRWRTVGRPADAWLQVDLGRVHPVGMVAWLPGGYQEVPLGFRLDTSTDRVQWTVAREVPTYYGPLYWAAGHPMGRVRWGRVEVRFPVRPARYVRVMHLGRDERFPWTVRELFVYEAGDPTVEPEVDAPAAARVLLAMGARRVYTDHGEGPRLAEAAGEELLTLPDNVRVDRYGLVPPIDRLPFLVPVRDAAVAYLAGAPSGPSIEATLRAAGVGFTLTEAGGYRLLGRLEPIALRGRVIRREPARVTAEPAGGDPRVALDGRVETRWSTGHPQAPGQWLQVEFGAAVELTGLELDLGVATSEYPRSLTVRVIHDGGWEDVGATVRWVGPLVWTGTHVLRAGVERAVVSFPPTWTRVVRIVQTGRDAVLPWSVAELRLLAP
jgi:F5/8 type C domain